MSSTCIPILTAQWPPQAGDQSLDATLREVGALVPGERIESVARAGEGNMNLVVRVTTSTRTLIVKQSRAWVEKYPSIAAPMERVAVEHEFYRAVEGLPGVAQRMPRVEAFHARAHVLVLEDLGPLTDLTTLYWGTMPEDRTLHELGRYLAALHEGTRASAPSFPPNLAMRRLNHQHIFVVPMDPQNGLELDGFEPGLKATAARVIADGRVRARVAELGQRYLSTGTCLIHGDFYPGSWVETERGVRVIDPEFAFAGDPEFDVGVALAHFRIADGTGALARRWLETATAQAILPLNTERIVAYAGVEIMRRLIGVAQLPLLSSDGTRANLLAVACRALVTPDAEDLCAC